VYCKFNDTELHSFNVLSYRSTILDSHEAEMKFPSFVREPTRKKGSIRCVYIYMYICSIYLKSFQYAECVTNMANISDSAVSVGVCCQFFNKALAPANYIFLTHPWWWRQYAPLKRRPTVILHGSTSQKTILNIIFSFLFWYWEVGRSKLYRYVDIDISILVYRLYNLTFSMPIKKQHKLTKSSREPLPAALAVHRCVSQGFVRRHTLRRKWISVYIKWISNPWDMPPSTYLSTHFMKDRTSWPSG
jgi:hypothetical protein